MKKTPVFICLLLIAALLCACAPSAQYEAYSGDYTLFAVETEGYIVEADFFDMSSVITLKANGKGYMTVNDEGGDIEEFSIDGDKITMKSGLSDLEGTISDGIMILDFGDDIVCYYALEGADVSGIEVLSFDDLLDIMSEE